MQDVALRRGADDPAQAQVDRRVELLTQRHDDVARLERARRRAGQQRRIEHAVVLGAEAHAGAVRRQDAGQRARRVEAAEAAPGDDHVPGHCGPKRIPVSAA